MSFLTPIFFRYPLKMDSSSQPSISALESIASTLSITISVRFGGSLNFCKKRMTVFVPVAPKVLLPKVAMAIILKFFRRDSRAVTKLSFSLFKMLLGRITAATPFGFNNCDILSTNSVSISEPSFEILSKIFN